MEPTGQAFGVHAERRAQKSGGSRPGCLTPRLSDFASRLSALDFLTSFVARSTPGSPVAKDPCPASGLSKIARAFQKLAKMWTMKKAPSKSNEPGKAPGRLRKRNAEVMQTTRRRWVVPPTDLAEQQGGLSGRETGEKRCLVRPRSPIFP